MDWPSALSLPWKAMLVIDCVTARSGAEKVIEEKTSPALLSTYRMPPWSEPSGFFAMEKATRTELPLGSASAPCQVPAMD